MLFFMKNGKHGNFLIIFLWKNEKSFKKSLNY